MSKTTVQSIDFAHFAKQQNKSRYAKPHYPKFMVVLWDLNPEKAIDHANQIIATIKHLTWYNADISMVKLLVMGLSLLDDDPHHQNLKQLVKRYQFEFGQEDSFQHFQNYQDVHGSTRDYQPYSFVLKPLVLEQLWQQPKLRNLMIEWLQLYRYYKRNYGVENPRQIQADTRKLKAVVQLLSGIVKADQIYLPAQDRRAKRTLTYQQWAQQLNHFNDILGVIGLWD